MTTDGVVGEISSNPVDFPLHFKPRKSFLVKSDSKNASAVRRAGEGQDQEDEAAPNLFIPSLPPEKLNGKKRHKLHFRKKDDEFQASKTLAGLAQQLVSPHPSPAPALSVKEQDDHDREVTPAGAEEHLPRDDEQLQHEKWSATSRSLRAKESSSPEQSACPASSLPASSLSASLKKNSKKLYKALRRKQKSSSSLPEPSCSPLEDSAQSSPAQSSPLEDSAHSSSSAQSSPLEDSVPPASTPDEEGNNPEVVEDLQHAPAKSSANGAARTESTSFAHKLKKTLSKLSPAVAAAQPRLFAPRSRRLTKSSASDADLGIVGVADRHGSVLLETSPGSSSSPTTSTVSSEGSHRAPSSSGKAGGSTSSGAGGRGRFAIAPSSAAGEEDHVNSSVKECFEPFRELSTASGAFFRLVALPSTISAAEDRPLMSAQSSSSSGLPAGRPPSLPISSTSISMERTPDPVAGDHFSTDHLYAAGAGTDHSGFASPDAGFHSPAGAFSSPQDVFIDSDRAVSARGSVGSIGDFNSACGGDSVGLSSMIGGAAAGDSLVVTAEGSAFNTPGEHSGSLELRPGWLELAQRLESAGAPADSSSGGDSQGQFRSKGSSVEGGGRGRTSFGDEALPQLYIPGQSSLVVPAEQRGRGAWSGGGPSYAYKNYDDRRTKKDRDRREDRTTTQAPGAHWDGAPIVPISILPVTPGVTGSIEMGTIGGVTGMHQRQDSSLTLDIKSQES